MGIKVCWTTSARNQLEGIFDYYKVTADLTFAMKIVRGIVRKSASLSKQPGQGQRDALLAGRQKKYGYIDEGNCRIIYWIDEATLYIAAVFDKRQYPVSTEKP